MSLPTACDVDTLKQATPGSPLVDDWKNAWPTTSADFDRDRSAFVKFWGVSLRALASLPPKAQRSAVQQQAAALLLAHSRESRDRFLARHVTAVYDVLTGNRRRFVRIEPLVSEAALHFPGLVPSAETLAAERPRLQNDKDGHEIDQGLLLSHILADATCGTHLCHTLLQTGPNSLAALEEFRKTGYVDLGTGFVERVGRAAVFNLRNPQFLNAEDESTLDVQEIGIDVCILDDASEIAVMRGARMETGKYAGRRVYSTGINLTQLYHGGIPFVWYLKRELGWLNKVFRGIASPEHAPDDIFGTSREKLWISAIDTFAIGGGCQYTLVMDYNIAGRDAYMTLPARKEGIIPGAANLRLPRFVGDRVARQAVMMERRIECNSPEGLMICDRLVDPDKVDEAVIETVDAITRSGVVSATGNRRAFRVAHEPLDLFRRYMAMYAREQAYCHFSPALISNLERFWNAHQRRLPA